MKVNKPIKILSCLLIAIIFLALGFHFGFKACEENARKLSSHSIPTPQATLAPIIIPPDWKTYTSTNSAFNFKYPGDLYTIDKSDEWIGFYKSLGDAQSTSDCFKYGLGTLDRPCGLNMVLNAGVRKYGKEGYITLREKYNQEDSSLPRVYSYTDKQNRVWNYVGPFDAEGMSIMNTELKIKDAFYSIDICVGIGGFSQYVGKELIVKTQEGGYDYTPLTQEQEKLAKKILSSFKFLENGIIGWSTYKNSDYSFTLKYPNSWIVTETKLQKMKLMDGNECNIGGVDLTNKTENVKLYIYYRPAGTCSNKSMRSGVGWNEISEKKVINIAGVDVSYEYLGDISKENPPIKEVFYNRSTFIKIGNLEFLFGTVEASDYDLSFAIEEKTVEEINNILKTLTIP